MAELNIIKSDNMLTLMAEAPMRYATNEHSVAKCLEAGQELLTQAQNGLSQELDLQIASYIEKTKKTIAKMKERRMPITQLFDAIRTEYTRLENTLSAKESVPAQLQEVRNRYAAQKRAEEEARRQETLRLQRIAEAERTYEHNLRENLIDAFSLRITKYIDAIARIEANISLDTYEADVARIKAAPTTITADKIASLITIPAPAGITTAEAIRQRVLDHMTPRLQEQFASQVTDMLNRTLDCMPSRLKALQAMAEASAEEAKQMADQLARQQAEEAERRQAEQAKLQAERQAQEAITRQQAEAQSLFAQQALIQDYQPNCKVTKRIEVLSQEGITAILAMWWSKQGCAMDIEALTKMFRKQITFCEKLAKDGVYIDDENIAYVDEVKAK